MVARSGLLALLLFVHGWAIAAIHEGFHLLVAKSFGYSGVISLSWVGEGTFTSSMPIGLERTAMLAAGGLGTATLYALLYWAARCDLRVTLEAIDDCAVLLFLAMQQILYTPLDMLGWWTNPYLLTLSFAGGGLVMLRVHGRVLFRWLFSQAR